jgi:hypothetical protein
MVGTWRGEGRVRDAGVTSTVSASLRDDGAIVIEHVTRHPGAADHRERIVLREHRGRTSAFIRAGSGPEQRFQNVPADAGFRFTRADPKLGLLSWEIVPEGADAFAERFVMDEEGAPTTVVSLRHVRVPA